MHEVGDMMLTGTKPFRKGSEFRAAIFKINDFLMIYI